VRAYLGLGSNLGDRHAHLASGVEGLAKLGSDLVVSRLYETEPVGGPQGQGPYLNCVVRLDTALTPHELLEKANELEAAAGRVRTVRNAARTLDIDLLLLDDLVIEQDDLVVPHPRMFERAFVLAPLEDLAPGLVPPGWRERLLPRGKAETGLVDVGTLQVG
jgi:2-amino-4-hydroxy-6-hydroxymethyldihydropteridine diphosphokinase